ncbi:Uu.00g119860.m01.CDS01 [Anthostomella pinea]|uniref:Uu.00g119860.m01.CDS01 n=1 Tax=Anthostomella pinea TaxID=933095 RepID=A0AAI8YHA8_9PEZI|nr:Uu.00g119860.m01.CDS01 [Anthostomella pinea]
MRPLEPFVKQCRITYEVDGDGRKKPAACRTGCASARDDISRPLARCLTLLDDSSASAMRISREITDLTDALAVVEERATLSAHL